MISKKLTIRENNFEKEYWYSYLFEGDDENKIDDAISEFCLKWYDEDPPDEVDLDGQKINFGEVWIKWWIEDFCKEEFIKELIGYRIRKV